MNADEKVAYQYLCNVFGVDRVTYEPDGNVPPDFAVQDGPAVEVRRLNRHNFDDKVPRGLEESYIRLWHSADRFLQTLGMPQEGRSWFVILRMRSPGQTMRAIRTQLRLQLKEFQAAPDLHPSEWDCADRVEVQLIESESAQEHAFVLGSINEGNQAYWVVSELIRNIQHCAEDKLAKIGSYRHRYEQWWLVLVDHISFGPSQENIEQLRKHLNPILGWNKIVLLGGKEAERVAVI